MRLARIVHAADTASDLDSEPGRAGTARRHPAFEAADLITAFGLPASL